MAQVLMKAVLLRGYGDVSQLSYEDVPVPVAAAANTKSAAVPDSLSPLASQIQPGKSSLIFRLCWRHNPWKVSHRSVADSLISGSFCGIKIN